MKNKIDFKLINSAIIMFIIYLLYQTSSLWVMILNKILTIVTPLFFAFIIAYALYPLLRFLMEKKVPKGVGVALIALLLVAIVVIFGVLVFPLLFSQLSNLFSAIITLIKDISSSFDVDMGSLQKTLTDAFNGIIMDLGKYVSDGAVNVIGTSLQYLTTVFIVFSIVIYFLIDMDSIRRNVKLFLRRKNKKMYKYVLLLDTQMNNYLSGFTKIMMISLFEYTLVYSIIGHPNAILLGFLALISNLIPYFGGMITNVLAGITAFVVSPALFIRTVIAFGILSVVDGNVINPYVYGKTNKVPPLVVIMSVFAGGILFGFVGIILSLPLAIIMITTINYFKEDISDKIEDIKEGNKKEKGSKN